MKKNKRIGNAIRVLAAGLWLAGWGLFPPAAGAAMPTHPVLSPSPAADRSPAGAGSAPVGAARPETGQVNKAQPAENAADKVWNMVRNRDDSGGEGQQSLPPRQPAAAGKPDERITGAGAPVSVPGKPAAPSGITVPERDTRVPHTAPMAPGREGYSPSPGAPAPVQAVTGYTEAEIREQMIRKHTRPRPAFRRASGGDVGPDYRPGTLDVKIPILFFPPDEPQDFSETFRENPDGTFGNRISGDTGGMRSGYGVPVQKQTQDQPPRDAQGAVQTGIRHQPAENRGQPPVSDRKKRPARAGASGTGQKTRVITVQVNVPAPSPFSQPVPGDFRWFTNNRGHYAAALLHSLPRDPLKGLPAEGPTVIRNAAQDEFMAVTVDDPADTYYFKNAGTFPTYGKAKPVYTETRKTVQGGDVDIQYIRYYIGGRYCLIVDGSCEKAGKTCRAAVVFPESKQYEYLPKALFVMENLKVI